MQFAEEAIDHYVSGRTAVLTSISAETAGDGLSSVHRLFDTFADEMIASNFQYGCLMQNLANELPSLEAELTERVARGFMDSTAIVAEHFKGCGFAPAYASAAALVAALEGARTIARLECTPAVFEALADVSAQRWASGAAQRPDVPARE